MKKIGWLRNVERQWLHTRMLLSPHMKQNTRLEDIIYLSFDEEQEIINAEKTKEREEWFKEAKKVWRLE